MHTISVGSTMSTSIRLQTIPLSVFGHFQSRLTFRQFHHDHCTFIFRRFNGFLRDFFRHFQDNFRFQTIIRFCPQMILESQGLGTIPQICLQINLRCFGFRRCLSTTVFWVIVLNHQVAYLVATEGEIQRCNFV